MTIHDFLTAKKTHKKISMVTCYDSWSAKLISQTEIDCVLVGDSVSMVSHGFTTTVPATMPMMVLHVAAAARSLSPKKFLVGDLPFCSYRESTAQAVRNATLLMQAGAHAVKLEGASGNLEIVRHLVGSGIPVMGHLGLTPQSVNQLGGFKVQGKTSAEEEQIYQDCLALETAGAFSVVLECVPSRLGARATRDLKIPTIGIGAGLDVDGQVLVLHDLLGLTEGFRPKFLKTYLSGAELIKKALENYHQDVVDRTFPAPEHGYE